MVNRIGQAARERSRHLMNCVLCQGQVLGMNVFKNFVLYCTSSGRFTLRYCAGAVGWEAVGCDPHHKLTDGSDRQRANCGCRPSRA